MIAFASLIVSIIALTQKK
ncbi:hypothetical protein [Cytobacillus solani]